jgi:hypothetical protein
VYDFIASAFSKGKMAEKKSLVAGFHPSTTNRVPSGCSGAVMPSYDSQPSSTAR